MKMPNASLGDIYDRMNDTAQTPRTHPASASLFTDWSLEAGDVVNISQGEDNYSVPIYVNKVKWQGAPTVEIESTGNREREPIAKASRQASGGGGGIEKTKGLIETTLESVLSIMPSICVISEDIVVMKGTLLAHDAQFSTISASVASIEGQLTASAIAAKLTDAQVVHVGGALQVDGDSDFTGGVEFNDQVVFQEKLTALGTVEVGGTDISTAFVGVSASTSGSTVTLYFTPANGGTPIPVNFNKAGTEVTGAAVSALNSASETEDRRYLSTGTITVNTTTGNIPIANVNVDVTGVWNQAYNAAKEAWYAAGWAAARARSAFAWSGANENVLTINRPGVAVDTSDSAVVYSISSYKASGDTLVNSAANYFTYNGRVYTTVTPQNDPDHPAQWTPSTTNVNKTQYINAGQ